MNNNDAELIQRTLEGDQQAYTVLVEKYQKQIHALAWQKIGDFHIAQEITQDAFLTAYQKLATLKHYNRFAGWLYVIADRKCKNWYRKRKLTLQSLEDTDPVELEEVYYSEYMARQREEAAQKKRRAIVQRLLSTLQESERTVVNLYYIAEMTCEDIGKFLGVSPNTVRSRLHRARNKLKKDETMIKENLSSFQLPTQLTENIMKEISHQNPVVPASNKPIVPFAASAASAILVLLLIGIGSQNLYRFQEPYSLNAQSEPTIEITETQLVIETQAKPAIRNQIGRTDVSGDSNSIGQNPGDSLFAAALSDDEKTPTPKRQWVQTNGPIGGFFNTLFTTTDGDIFTGTSSTLYKLAEDQSKWKLVYSTNTSTFDLSDWALGQEPMAERGDTLFLVTSPDLLTSNDRGETWNSLGPHPKGFPVGIAVTDSALYLGISKSAVKPNETFTDGIYTSVDGGKTWNILTDDILAGKNIRSLGAIDNTVFAGTDEGLYRFLDGKWNKLSIGPDDMQEKKFAIPSLAVTEDWLYVVAGLNYSTDKSVMTSESWWSLYRSSDLGESWEIIDPRNKQQKSGLSVFLPIEGIGKFPYLGINVTANNEKLLLSEHNSTYYSTDNGETWSTIDRVNLPEIVSIYPFLVLDDKTFYKNTHTGISRSTDGGESWHKINKGLTSSTVVNLIAVDGKLYARTNDVFVSSTDGGETWKSKPFRSKNISMMSKYDNTLYVKKTDDNISILRLSTKDNKLIDIPDIPELGDVKTKGEFEFDVLTDKVLTDKGINSVEQGNTIDFTEVDFEKLEEEFTNLFQKQVTSILMPIYGNFAVSGNTYYMEYIQKLYRWKPDMSEWHDTGIIDLTKPKLPPNLYDTMKNSTGISALIDIHKAIGFKLAVSGKNIYVGKHDGHLFYSSDEGDNWKDVTDKLPLSYQKIHSINYAGPVIYVATDKGFVYSTNDSDWITTTDTEGTPIVIEQFTVDGTTIYGVVGLLVYKLKENSDTWKQMTPEIPSPISSLAVDDNTLYVGTLNRGVLRYTLDE